MKNPSFFIKNLGWKFISLLLAFVLWLVGINATNPEITQIYKVPLSLENTSHISDNNLVLLNNSQLSSTFIYVKVKATRNDMLLLSTSKLKAFIDFKDTNVTNPKYLGIVQSMGLTVPTPDTRYEILDYTPKTTNVEVDKLVSKDFDVEVTNIGTVNSKYATIVAGTASPSKITISGAATQINNIAKVVVKINVNEKTSDVTDTLSPIIFDKNNKDITSQFKISDNKIVANVPVYKYGKVNINTPTWAGAVVSGYQITDSVVSPTSIDVVGPASIIDKLQNIDLPQLDVSGKSDNVLVTTDINTLLPNNVTVKNGSVNKATTTLTVEQVVSRKIEVNTSNLSIKNQTKEVELPATFEVTISGPISAIQGVKASDISGTVDVGNLKEGVNLVKIYPTIANNKVSINSQIMVTAIFNSITASPTPTDGTSPMDNAIPTDGTVPTDSAIPTDGILPTDSAIPTPTDGIVPIVSATPTDGTVPIVSATPTDGIVPIVSATPTDGTVSVHTETTASEIPIVTGSITTTSSIPIVTEAPIESDVPTPVATEIPSPAPTVLN